MPTITLPDFAMHEITPAAGRTIRLLDLQTLNDPRSYYIKSYCIDARYNGQQVQQNHRIIPIANSPNQFTLVPNHINVGANERLYLQEVCTLENVNPIIVDINYARWLLDNLYEHVELPPTKDVFLANNNTSLNDASKILVTSSKVISEQSGIGLSVKMRFQTSLAVRKSVSLSADITHKTVMPSMVLYSIVKAFFFIY